ncbi:winged helix-turn-helix transcriptional regulator [Nocardia jejuensis]|uniref:winged helix-turn-helix transcriptional regulator n=1 Tax=Nocardia jejuensis TaxID=328049 RepID=UPI00082C1296|nr:helix-turn-helix domain-containing protein [Nocardia jejuensis]
MEDKLGAVGAAGIGPCAGLPAGRMDSIREVLDRVGDKWSLLVISVLENGPRRYGDLHYAVTGISQRMLTLTLRQLTQDGLVSRTSYPEVPPRVEYALTPLGQGLYEIVSALIEWTIAHHDEIQRNRSRDAESAATAREFSTAGIPDVAALSRPEFDTRS